VCPPTTPVVVAKRILNLPALSSKSVETNQLAPGRTRLLYIIREDCSDTTKPERLAYKALIVKANQKMRNLKTDLKAGVVSHKALKS
jgi:hypothetical protein